MDYYSQTNQDKYLDINVFKKMNNGFFVDIGAHDGITYSNTYFFEKHRNWKGICIEPLPDVFQKLMENRDCILVNGGLGKENKTEKFLKIEGYSEMLSGLSKNYTEEHLKRIEKELKENGGYKTEIDIQCYNINTLLKENNVKTIDYCSIDVEGSEFEIIKTFDFEKFDVKVFSIENNYKDYRIRNLLEEKGYYLYTILGADDIFIKKSENIGKIPISAVIVTFNEEKYLEKCLRSVNFCEEIIVIDLGSKDKSKQIALNCGAKLIEHERVPVVEIIHSKIEQYVSNKWVLITDPDEVTDISLANEIINIFNSNKLIDNKVGAVNVPLLFYYKGRKLYGTIWGGINERILIVNIDRFTFTSDVHAGRKIKNNFDKLQIEFNGTNAIHHYWMDNFKKLLEKHKRYLKYEGKSRYDNGRRTNLKKIIKLPYKEFKRCFYEQNGYKDGFTGLILSIFWVWYDFSAEVALLKHQKNQ